MYRGDVSPDQRMVLYHLHTESTTPVLAFLHRLLPKFFEARLQTESLWISNIDGQGFHEMGHVIMPKDKPDDAEESELSGMEWLPGNKQVAFVYRHTLYVAPVK